MTGRLVTTILALAVAVGAYPRAVHSRQTPQASFQARTDLVVVDVTVRQDNASVTDLAASEFRVLDDGVPQTVQFGGARDAPLDLSVLNDDGSMVDGMAQRARFQAGLQAVADLLRPGDRLAVWATASPVRELLPLTPVPLTVPPPRAFGGWPRTVDALAQALLIPGVAGRRHLLMVQSNGLDAVHVTDPARLPDLAKRSDAVVDLALTYREPGPMLDRLLETARLTGGEAFNAKDVEDATRQVLASLEHAYLLTYVATGVQPGGWHTIAVQVTRPGTFTIGARHGYFGG